MSGQVRCTCFYDPTVYSGVRFAFGRGLAYISTGRSEARSSSGQVRPIFF